MLVNQRIEFVEKTGGRQTAPAFMPQRFMPGATAAPTDILRTRGARKQGRHPVAQFNPGDGGLGDRVVFAGNMKDLCPEPFTGVNAADVAGVIDLTWRMAQTGNRFGFFH